MEALTRRAARVQMPNKGSRRRKIKTAVAWRVLRGGEPRLAAAILLWPRGWSHTRLDEVPDMPAARWGEPDGRLFTSAERFLDSDADLETARYDRDRRRPEDETE